MVRAVAQTLRELRLISARAKCTESLTVMAGLNYTDEEMGEAQPQRNTNRKTKGRGFQETGAMDIDDDRAGAYDTHSDITKGPVKCKFQ